MGGLLHDIITCSDWKFISILEFKLYSYWFFVLVNSHFFLNIKGGTLSVVINVMSISGTTWHHRKSIQPWCV